MMPKLRLKTGETYRYKDHSFFNKNNSVNELDVTEEEAKYLLGLTIKSRVNKRPVIEHVFEQVFTQESNISEDVEKTSKKQGRPKKMKKKKEEGKSELLDVNANKEEVLV